MVSLARCHEILADHPKIHPQSLAAKEYERLGLASLPFMDRVDPNKENEGFVVKDEQFWDYQRQWSSEIEVHEQASPSFAVKVDHNSLPPAIHRIEADDRQVAKGNAKGKLTDPQLVLDGQKGIGGNNLQHTEVEAEEHMLSEIQALGLRGLNVLVYIFLARHGSLEAAFDYMDANHTGQVSLNAWTTCLLVMRFPLEQLVGLTPLEIFSRIDTHGSNTISRDEFLSFFQNVQRGAHKGKKVSAASTTPSNPVVQRSPVAEDFGLEQIENEEARVLAALGSLDDKLDGGQANQGSAVNSVRERHGRPPRPKPSKRR